MDLVISKDKFHFSNNHFNHAIKVICDDIILNDDLDNSLIVTLQRGGLVPATYVSYQTGISDFLVLDPKSSSSLNHFRKELSVFIDKGYSRIIIIDEINDSGNTLTALNHFIESSFDNHNDSYVINNYVLVSRSTSTFETTEFRSIKSVFTLDDSRWVLFPWDKGF